MTLIIKRHNFYYDMSTFFYTSGNRRYILLKERNHDDFSDVSNDSFLRRTKMAKSNSRNFKNKRSDYHFNKFSR